MILVLLVACLVLAADRASKAFIVTRLGAGRPVSVGSFLHIRRSLRRFLPHGLIHDCAMLLLWFAALAGIVLAIDSGRFFQSPMAQMGLSAALAGSASNLCDRMRNGAIVDFLDLGWWPIFNMADVAITLGVLTAFWFM